MVRKFKIAGFPLQLYLNKKAVCLEKEPRECSQPEWLGREMQHHSGKRERDAGRGLQEHPSPPLGEAIALTTT